MLLFGERSPIGVVLSGGLSGGQRRRRMVRRFPPVVRRWLLCGTVGRAPALVDRNFDAGFVLKVTSDGIPNTGMPALKDRLSPADLHAVVARVGPAQLSPTLRPSWDSRGAREGRTDSSRRPSFPGQAAYPGSMPMPSPPIETKIYARWLSV